MAPLPPLTSTSLLEVNARVHSLIQERMLAFLEAVTALAFDDAAAAFASFQDLLLSHLRYEDAEAFVVLERLYSVYGDEGDLLPKHLDGDHRILERSLRKAEAALERLRNDELDPRRAMVLELDTFLQLRRVLEHHDARETRFAYPFLDAHVGDDEREALRAGLGSVLSPTDP